MKRKKKRINSRTILSMMLALCLAAGTFPATAYAEGTESAAEAVTEETSAEDVNNTGAAETEPAVSQEETGNAELPAESETAAPVPEESTEAAVPEESTEAAVPEEGTESTEAAIPEESTEAAVPEEGTESTAPEESTEAAAPEETESMEWKDQSEGVDTTLGDPDQTQSGQIENMPEEYTIFVDPKTGVYKLTYTIGADVDAENLTIDLTKALEALRAYAGVTDSNWMEPGDSRVFEIYIQTDSKHTYKYKDGSFTLQTPEMDPGKNPDGSGTPSTGFDGQELEDQYEAKDVDLELSTRTEPIKKLFKETGIETDDWVLNNQTRPYELSAEQQEKLNQHFHELYGTDNIKDGMEAYLIAYYAQKDNAQYKDFDEMLLKSPNASKELTGTQSDFGQLQIDGDFVTIPVDPSYRYNNFYQNLINFVYGTKEDIDNATGGMTGVQTTTKFSYEKIPAYDEEGNAVECNGLVPLYETPYYNDWGWILEMSGYPKDILVDPQAKDLDSLKLYKNEAGEWITAANSAAYGKEITSTQAEYENDSWTSEGGMKNQIAEYMKKADAECWKKANEFFNELTKKGISADDAAGISFMMAFNFDGELMGNINQNTDWGWNNTIDLERIDGELKLEKVDENGNVIGDEEGEGETSFYLWYQETEKDQEGNDKEVYYYYTYIPSDDAYGFVKYDEKQNEMDFTIQTVNGKLDIDYALLENVVYYLQEAVAPEGYEIDTNIYIIADEEQYESLVKGNTTITNAVTGGTFTVQDDCVVWQGGGIDSEKTLEIKFVNKKTVTPPGPTDPTDPIDPTDPPNPVDPTDPADPTDPEVPETLVPVSEEGIEILDQDVPLGELPELIDIVDEDVPLGRLPQTGQSWDMIWILTAAGMLMMLIGMTKKRGEYK